MTVSDLDTLLYMCDALCYIYYMVNPFMQRPYIHPCAYGVFSPDTQTIYTCCYYCYYCFTATIVFTLLLPLYHCYY